MRLFLLNSAVITASIHSGLECLKENEKPIERPYSWFRPALQNLIRRLVFDKKVLRKWTHAFISGTSNSIRPNQQLEIDRLTGQFEADPFAPPSVKECQDSVGDDVYRAMLDIGVLTEVAQDVVFRTIDYQRMQSEVRTIIDQNGSITVAQARYHFNTSRKFILAS